MESLTERYDSLQENLLQLYEAGSDKIEDHILYWDIVRHENVLLYYARQKGIGRLGLQPVPTLTVSEYKAKQAIGMSLQLKSLKESEYGKEPWTMQDTSYEIYSAAPKNTFKKGAFTVDVYYDEDQDNYYPYTAWTNIYYQNGDNKWHKVEGQADYEGLFYVTVDGEKIYYVEFNKDAVRFSRNGVWTVKYKKHEISSNSVTSTSGNTDGAARDTEQQQSPRSSTNTVGQEKKRRRQRESSSSPPTKQLRSSTSQSDGDTSSSPVGPRLRRRQRREREQASQRRELRTAGSSYPSPEEVGRRHRLVEGKNHSRLRQLQDEARDPPLILLTGPANTLKCYRNRFKSKYRSLVYATSTVFSWVGEGTERLGQQKMLIAFHTSTERSLFLKSVVLPKGVKYTLGHLDSL